MGSAEIDVRTLKDAEIGSLSDDVDFVKLIKRDESGAVSCNLVHIAPLLRFIGEKIKR